MNLTEAIRVALQSLWANKLRSILTLLGVVIGVGAVIAVLTFVSGINRYIAEKVFNLGADVFIINKHSSVITNIDQLIEGEKRKDLALEDYYAVAEGCNRCTDLGAMVTNLAGEVKYEQQSITNTFVRGLTPSMPAILNMDLSIGRAINDADINNHAQIAVIGTDVVDNLFPGEDPLDKEIRVAGQPYRIVGIGKKQGTTLGQSRDNYVMIPITAYLKQYGRHNSIIICGKADGVGSQLDAAMDEARVILRARRHDAPGAADSFAIETNENFLSLWQNLTQTFFIAMIAIAATSLVVGGRGKDVLMQFLIESGTVALVGGFLGVVGGVFLAKTVTLIIGMPSSVPLWAVAAALIVSSSVGLFFGVYPASRAARLDPITALRFEL
jgi:putative ABC transport system permease protein